MRPAGTAAASSAARTSVTLRCAAQVPVGRVYTARDIAEDPHYRARGMIERIITADGLSVSVPGIVPKLSLTPGAIRRPAPALGQDQPSDVAHPSIWD